MRTAHKQGLVAMGFALMTAPLFAASGLALTPAKDSTAATTPQSVLVYDQKINNKTVIIKYAYLPKDGFVVIYGSDASGKITGEPIGSAALKAGDHRDLRVTLANEPKAGTKLWAALYDDSDHKSSFDKTDKPLWAMNKLPLQNMFKVE